MIEQHTNSDPSRHLLHISKEAIFEDALRIRDNWENNYRTKRKQNLMALKNNINRMEVYKAIKEAQHASLMDFTKEFKNQRWKLIHKDAIKAEKQKLWKNSEEYKEQQTIKQYVQQYEEKHKHELVEQKVQKDEENCEFKDPLSGISNEASSMNSPEKLVFKLTGSELVQEEEKVKKGPVLVESQIYSKQKSIQHSGQSASPSFDPFPVTSSVVKGSLFYSEKLEDGSPKKAPEKEKQSEKSINFEFSSGASKAGGLFGKPTSNEGSSLFGGGGLFTNTQGIKPSEDKKGSVFNQPASTSSNDFASLFSNKNPQGSSLFGVQEKKPEEKTPGSLWNNNLFKKE